MKRFEDVVNSEFLEKYGDKIDPVYGAVDKNGKVSYRVLEDVFMKYQGSEYPNQFIYALIHGPQSLIDSWSIPARFRGQEERIYGLCLQRDTDWKEAIGYKQPKEDVLL